MKWALNIVGVILVLVGLVWILQGVNVLPGTFMSGKPLYAALGLVLDVIGLGLFYFANRRRQKMG